MNVYSFINWFFSYSFMGYLLECIVLSVEYKRPVMDRGFGHGPFCIIYGFGALGASLLLHMVPGNPLELYVVTVVMATTMELVTAHIMVRLFGAFWWDYSHKPFNYKGMICLESSLAWGFLGLFFFYFLDHWVRSGVRSIPKHMGMVLAAGLAMFYFVDFLYCLHMRLNGMEEEGEVVGRLKIY